jgi:hypothetical protein
MAMCVSVIRVPWDSKAIISFVGGDMLHVSYQPFCTYTWTISYRYGPSMYLPKLQKPNPLAIPTILSNW